MTAAEQTPERWFRRHGDWLAVLLCAAAVFFIRSWEGDLHGDPVHYAAVAKNIVSTGNWLELQDEPGRPYHGKPPLMMWLVALNFKLFGPSTYAALFWSCAFGVAAAVITCLLGRRLFGRAAGLLAGCMAALSPGFVTAASDLRLESAVTLAVVTTVYALVRAHQENRPCWLLLVGLAAGLGTMTKVVAIAHVGVIAIVFLSIWRPRWLVHPWFLAALGLAALLVAPWHLYMMQRARDAFTERYLDKEAAARIVLGVHFFANLLKHVSVLVVLSMPWSLFAAYAIAQRRRASSSERWGIWVALLWIAEVVVLMAVPPKAYARYLAPAYPAVALVAGYGLSLVLSERVRGRLPGYVARLTVAFAMMLALIPVKLHSYNCEGYTHARAVLDHVAPGPSVAWYGPEGGEPSWGLRAKSIYYLDRTVAPYTDLGALDQDGIAFVIADKKPEKEGGEKLWAELRQHGFRDIFPLEPQRRLFHRQTPPR